MKPRHGLVLVVLAGLACAAHALDLARLDRTIAKEPAYESKQPRYCLLVFGPEAKTRVWLVIDGDTLRVDRNANGDLTDAGESVRFSPFRKASWEQASEEREARVESISDAPFKHVNLQVRQMRLRPDFSPRDESDRQLQAIVRNDPAALTCDVSVDVDLRRLPGAKLELSGQVRQTAGVDAEGWLQFADKPGNAPVIHFGGALHMALLVKHSLVLGEKPADLMTMLGTPGAGPGTFASIPFNGLISDRTHPAAQIVFRAKDGRSEPITVQAVLKHRC